MNEYLVVARRQNSHGLKGSLTWEEILAYTSGLATVIDHDF